MIASTRALQRLFHYGSESNGLVATGQLILGPNTVLRGFFSFSMLKCNEMQMAVIRSNINEFRRFL